MTTLQQKSFVAPSYNDKRKAGVRQDGHSRITEGTNAFVANAAGTTTTIVGANAAPGTNDDQIVRRNEKFQLFTSAGVLKEETVFRTTTIAVGASTTVTFTPAAAVATASGDRIRLVKFPNDVDSLDRRLLAIGYSASRITQMTLNDKIYAVRLADDPRSL
jgi:hypothetical protein